MFQIMQILIRPLFGFGVRPHVLSIECDRCNLLITVVVRCVARRASFLSQCRHSWVVFIENQLKCQPLFKAATSSTHDRECYRTWDERDAGKCRVMATDTSRRCLSHQSQSVVRRDIVSCWSPPLDLPTASSSATASAIYIALVHVCGSTVAHELHWLFRRTDWITDKPTRFAPKNSKKNAVKNGEIRTLRCLSNS